MATLPLPSDKHPVVDPKTGKMNPDWYSFFKELTKIINEGL